MNKTPTIKLDARPDRIDLRDRMYQPPLRNLVPEYPSADLVERYLPRYASHGMVLDQGHEGACTGFGLAATINYLFWRRNLNLALTQADASEPVPDFEPPSKVSPRMLYHLARFYDEWPGEDYEGSSCRGAIKAWHRHGVCREKLWPYRNGQNRAVFVRPKTGWDSDAAKRPLGVYYRIHKDDVTDIQAAIQQVGAVYVSAKVHEGWMTNLDRGKITHANLPLIPYTEGAEIKGGHAFALVGYNARGFIVQNSWAERWGKSGFAVLGYDDWLANATDAWVCVLGVPRADKVPGYYVSRSIATVQEATGPAQLFGFGRTRKLPPRAVPRWDESEAYRHSLIMGNEGKVYNRLVDRSSPEDSTAALAYEAPKAFFDSLPPGQTPRLMIYAHGGLNSEEDSINRIRSLGPYAQANNVYPLFLTWRTGFVESLIDIMSDAAGRVFPRSEGLADWIDAARGTAEDALDRTLEVVSANLGVKAVWSQMKQNAAASSLSAAKDRGSFLATKELARLKKAVPALEIHLVGHSAGSILLGHMLSDFPRNKLKVRTFTLYAPACTLDFANRFLATASTRGLFAKQDLHLHVLTDARERDDAVGPYRKSLLYLVSRALEDWHKTPILGMLNALEPTDEDDSIWSPNTRSSRKKWRESMKGVNIHPLDAEQVTTAVEASGNKLAIPAAHGSFDNDIDVVTATLLRITDAHKLVHPVADLRY